MNSGGLFEDAPVADVSMPQVPEAETTISKPTGNVSIFDWYVPTQTCVWT